MTLRPSSRLLLKKYKDVILSDGETALILNNDVCNAEHLGRSSKLIILQILLHNFMIQLPVRSSVGFIFLDRRHRFFQGNYNRLAKGLPSFGVRSQQSTNPVH